MTKLQTEKTRLASSLLARPIESLHGIGEARARNFKLLGVRTLGELLEYFPRTYQYESPERQIDQLIKEQIQTARGQVVAVDYIPVRPRPRFEATIDDGVGKMGLIWFNGSYLRNKIFPGKIIRVKGKVRFYHNVPQMVNPEWREIDEDAERIERSTFRPIYPAMANLPTELIHRVIDQNLDDAVSQINEWYQPDLLTKRGLLPRRDAYLT